MKKLILLTDSFPYGSGEKTFIEPELEYLKQEFEITIISSASLTELENVSLKSIVDSNIKVMHYEVGAIKKWEIISYIVPFFFSEAGRLEFEYILKDKKKIGIRLKKSLFFWANGEKFRRWMSKKRIIEDCEKTLVYSYWYDYHALSVVTERIERGCSNIILLTRTHGCDLYDERIIGADRQPFKEYMDKNLDRIVFASQYGYNYYLNRFFKCKKDIKYIISKIGAPKPLKRILYQNKSDKRRFRVVSCSHVIPLKRVDLIIDSLSMIKEFRVEWIHFGDGYDFEKVQEYASKKIGNRTNIYYKFTGYISRTDIYQYYSKNFVDCFLTVSETEGGCPVSIQEAMAHGIPIIGTNVGGITEMIDGNGILLEAHPTAKCVSDAIRKMYELNAKEIFRMRKRSHEIWEQEYMDTANAERFVKYLVNLMEKDGNEYK